MRIHFKNRPSASAGGEHTGSPLHIRRKREASLSLLVVTTMVMAVDYWLLIIIFYYLIKTNNQRPIAKSLII